MPVTTVTNNPDKLCNIMNETESCHEMIGPVQNCYNVTCQHLYSSLSVLILGTRRSTNFCTALQGVGGVDGT